MTEHAGYAELEIAIVLDSDGSYAVAKEIGEAQELYNGENEDGSATETIVLKLRKRLPKAIEISGDLPQNDDGTYRLEIHQS
jgi:hypothetical protein